jgi:hypothetical protein
MEPTEKGAFFAKNPSHAGLPGSKDKTTLPLLPRRVTGQKSRENGTET